MTCDEPQETGARLILTRRRRESARATRYIMAGSYSFQNGHYKTAANDCNYLFPACSWLFYALHGLLYLFLLCSRWLNDPG